MGKRKVGLKDSSIVEVPIMESTILKGAYMRSLNCIIDGLIDDRMVSTEFISNPSILRLTAATRHADRT